MNVFVYIGLFLVVIALIVFLYHTYIIHFNNRFKCISKGKFYRSAAMPPHILEKYVNKYGIKTIVDLRHGYLLDKLNPEKINAVQLEAEAVEKFPNTSYYHIPSNQIPSEDNLNKFFEIIDNKASYPILVHCHHGCGRAIIYSAVYRIEIEKFSPEKARLRTKFPVFFTSFEVNKPKGKWLKQYVPRSVKEKELITSHAFN